MGEPCTDPANDNLGVNTVHYHSCDFDDKPLPSSPSGGGMPMDALTSMRPGMQVGDDFAATPYEHKSMSPPVRDNPALYNITMDKPDEYVPTASDLRPMMGHEHGGIPYHPEPTNKHHFLTGKPPEMNNGMLQPQNPQAPWQQTQPGPAPLEDQDGQGGPDEWYNQQPMMRPLGELQQFPKAEPPCEAFQEGRIRAYPNGYGCASDTKRTLGTSIAYTDDIKDAIKQTKTYLRLIDRENDPMPFPNMFGASEGGNCCEEHPKNNQIAEKTNKKSPSTRLRELNEQMRAKTQQAQCMNAEYKRDLGTSIPYAADKVRTFGGPYSQNPGGAGFSQNFGGGFGGGSGFSQGGCHGVVYGGYGGVGSPTIVNSPRTEVMSLPCAFEIPPFQEIVPVRPDGVAPMQLYEAPMATVKPSGTTIPFRSDHEPPPKYTKPPQPLPYVLEDQIETLNIETRSNMNSRLTPMTLMGPVPGLMSSPGSVESRPFLPQAQSGEMILTRTPRNPTWQEAYHQIRQVNAAGRPVSAERYKVASTCRDTVKCEYTPPVIGQRPPVPHVHVQQSGSHVYKQHLYPDGKANSHYLWKKVEGKAGVGDSRFWF